MNRLLSKNARALPRGVAMRQSERRRSGWPKRLAVRVRGESPLAMRERGLPPVAAPQRAARDRTATIGGQSSIELVPETNRWSSRRSWLINRRAPNHGRARDATPGPRSPSRGLRPELRSGEVDGRNVSGHVGHNRGFPPLRTLRSPRRRAVDRRDAQECGGTRNNMATRSSGIATTLR